MSRTVLIVEDDPDIANLIGLHLQDLDYTVVRAADGPTGLMQAMHNTFDLIILDLMLPKMDGLDVCKRIRAENAQTPILILSARAEELDKVLGLELGADDYMTKPFSIRELLARIKAIFRRIEVDGQTAEPMTQHIQLGDLSIELNKRKVVLSNQKIELTAKEYDLLTLFASNPGHTYSRRELLDIVWGYQFDGYEHTVNSHINRLRNKIEVHPSQPQFIKTVWGVGYRFAEAEEL